MSAPTAFRCARCGELHDLPFAFATEAPTYWRPEFAEQERCVLGGENCEIDDDFFVRGRIRIPVHDADDDFEWGVWVTLSESNYERMLELWNTPGREGEPAYFGWLSTDLPLYQPSTLNLKTMVHTRPVGERPLIELEQTDHPLAVEQREGVTLDRVREIALELLHPERV